MYYDTKIHLQEWNMFWIYLEEETQLHFYKDLPVYQVS